jgi:hypothetical protein
LLKRCLRADGTIPDLWRMPLQRLVALLRERTNRNAAARCGIAVCKQGALGMSHENLKKMAGLALAGVFALAMAGTTTAAPMHHHFRHYAYHHHHYRYGPGPVGAALGAAAGIVGGAAAAATGYPYGYGPYSYNYGPYGYGYGPYYSDRDWW